VSNCTFLLCFLALIRGCVFQYICLSSSVIIDRHCSLTDSQRLGRRLATGDDDHQAATHTSLVNIVKQICFKNLFPFKESWKINEKINKVKDIMNKTKASVNVRFMLRNLRCMFIFLALRHFSEANLNIFTLITSVFIYFLAGSSGTSTASSVLLPGRFGPWALDSSMSSSSSAHPAIDDVVRRISHDSHRIPVIWLFLLLSRFRLFGIAGVPVHGQARKWLLIVQSVNGEIMERRS
jgi:hypothetical protein